jgi:proteasome lid subunit RPN8/RPN11
LARAHVDELFRELRGAFPNEACGYLAGKDALVSRVLPIGNIAGTEDVARMSGQLVSDFPAPTTGFVMDPRDQLRALRGVDDAGEDVLAIYHTHPHSRPYPSERDVRYATERSYALYVLLSEHAGRPDLHAYVIRDDGAVEEVPVEVSDRA